MRAPEPIARLVDRSSRRGGSVSERRIYLLQPALTSGDDSEGHPVASVLRTSETQTRARWPPLRRVTVRLPCIRACPGDAVPRLTISFLVRRSRRTGPGPRNRSVAPPSSRATSEPPAPNETSRSSSRRKHDRARTRTHASREPSTHEPTQPPERGRAGLRARPPLPATRLREPPGARSSRTRRSPTPAPGPRAPAPSRAPSRCPPGRSRPPARGRACRPRTRRRASRPP
jgi:hypothetical protein